MKFYDVWRLQRQVALDVRKLQDLYWFPVRLPELEPIRKRNVTYSIMADN